MRRLLVALLGVMGAGAAVASPAVAYSHVGRAVVTVLREMPDATVTAVVNGAAADDNFPIGTPLIVNHPEEGLYNGTLQIRPVTALGVMIPWFYTRICGTKRWQDCGLIPPDLNKDGEQDWPAATGTSLDEWWEFRNMVYEAAFSSGPSNPSEPPSLGHYDIACTNGTDTAYFASSSYYDPVYQRYYFYSFYRYPNTGWYRLENESPVYAPPEFPTVQLLNGLCPPPTIAAFRDGNYWTRTPGPMPVPPVPHPDIEHGVRLVLEHTQAELDRTQTPFVFISGLQVNPGMDSRFLVGDEVAGRDDEGGEPGGGGGDVDPGTCEDGWFLTRVVCEIREFSRNTWEFISHDAWVPQTPWGERWQGVVEAAQTRFPFTVMAQLPGRDVTGEFTGWGVYDPEEEACRGFKVQMFGFGGLVSHEESEQTVQLCGTPVGNWLRENRGFIYYFFFVALSVSFFLQVVRA